MKRTQLYLDDSQRKKLDGISEKTGKPLAALVREAVDQYLVKGQQSSIERIIASGGLWRDMTEIRDSDEYVDCIRKKWGIDHEE